MQRSIYERRAGFSFLEVLAGVVILGIVAALFLPHITTSGDLAREHADEEYKVQINAAVERFYLNEDRWPACDLSDIGRDRRYFPAGLPKNPIDGTAYSLCPSTHRVE